MKSKHAILAILTVLIIVAGLFYLKNQSTSTVLQPTASITANDDETSPSTEISSRYIDYSAEKLAKATANKGKAVLFFAALKWCPSCQAADKDFKAHFNQVPKDITVLKVDYDTAKDMKQKYAITMQDTFIQVDSQGNEMTRWNSGGQGLEALLANAK